jgi:hypothetical protein
MPARDRIDLRSEDYEPVSFDQLEAITVRRPCLIYQSEDGLQANVRLRIFGSDSSVQYADVSVVSSDDFPYHKVITALPGQLYVRREKK